MAKKKEKIQRGGAILERNKVVAKFLHGGYPCNHLPNLFLKPSYIVVNTDPSNKSEKHWIAIAVEKEGCEIFNSFGALQPLRKEFRQFLQKHSRDGYSIFNVQRIQSDFSVTCGIYCVSYVLNRAQRKSMKSFLKQFHKTILKRTI